MRSSGVSRSPRTSFRLRLTGPRRVADLGLPAYTILTCFHPSHRRRRYQVDDTWCEVCATCLNVRSSDGFWQPTARIMHPDGTMTSSSGELVHTNWRELLQR